GRQFTPSAKTGLGRGRGWSPGRGRQAARPRPRNGSGVGPTGSGSGLVQATPHHPTSPAPTTRHDLASVRGTTHHRTSRSRGDKSGRDFCQGFEFVAGVTVGVGWVCRARRLRSPHPSFATSLSLLAPLPSPSRGGRGRVGGAEPGGGGGVESGATQGGSDAGEISGAAEGGGSRAGG